MTSKPPRGPRPILYIFGISVPRPFERDPIQLFSHFQRPNEIEFFLTYGALLLDTSLTCTYRLYFF